MKSVLVINFGRAGKECTFFASPPDYEKMYNRVAALPTVFYFNRANRQYIFDMHDLEAVKNYLNGLGVKFITLDGKERLSW